MVARSTVLTVLSILVFPSLVASSPWHSRDFTTFPSLFGRQDVPQPDESTCLPSCDLDTCGSGSCNIAGSLVKRATSDIGSHLEWFGSSNTSAVGRDELKHISKRFWKFTPGSKTPVGDSIPTIGQVDRYMPAVFNNEVDWDYYGEPLGLDTGVDSSAFSQEVQFIDPDDGDEPFQIMTGGIHGCMTVTLVSNRAVWMAHFWESYSQGMPRRDNPPREPIFVERVLNFILGIPVRRPKSNNPRPGASGKPLPYIEPSGPAPTAELYNRPDDDTVLYISTPIGDSANINDENPKLFYQERVKLMKAAFVTRLGFTPSYEAVPYDRLDYADPKQKALKDKTHRGMHLFQYDNNADNKGQRAWRYFCEQKYFLRNLP